MPVAATALLPLVLLPLLGVQDIHQTAAPFAHPLIFLFLGGFLLALAHAALEPASAIALHIVALTGDRPAALVGGIHAGIGLPEHVDQQYRNGDDDDADCSLLDHNYGS